MRMHSYRRIRQTWTYLAFGSVVVVVIVDKVSKQHSLEYSVSVLVETS